MKRRVLGTLTPENLNEHVSRAPSGCWEWRQTRDRKGYGRKGHDGRTRIAGRIVVDAHDVEGGGLVDPDFAVVVAVPIDDEHLVRAVGGTVGIFG